MSWDDLPINWMDNLFLRIQEQKWSHRYRLEREASEWIDLGGEA